MLVHGPVRVPSDTPPGDAILRVKLPPTSTFQSRPTYLRVTIQ